MKIIFIPILTLLFSFTALAQNAKVNKKEKLTDISFEGLSLDIPVQVMIDKTGLKIGQLIDEKDRYQALNNLVNTYLFRHIDIDSVSLSGNIKLTFIVDQAPRASGTCIFQNFEDVKVAEITDAIKNELPDYKGKITRVDFVVGKLKPILYELLKKKKMSGDIFEKSVENFVTGEPVFVFILKATQE